jgi:hypothetical protein
VDAGLATYNRLLSKQRDRIVAILAELRTDTTGRHATIAVNGNVEQVLRLVIGAVDIVSH